jgi:hypothetical protein
LGGGDIVCFFAREVNFFKVVENHGVEKSSPMYFGIWSRIARFEEDWMLGKAGKL